MEVAKLDPSKAVCPVGGRAVLATMHGKARVIAPLALRFLGLAVDVVPDLDTDVFGTFSRDIPRTGSSLQTARRKIAAAFDLDPTASIGLSSEGSFGPHPYIPFLALDREIVMLVDRGSGLELVGRYATPATNFSHLVVTDVASGRAFAHRVGFPHHGVIVMGYLDLAPASEIALVKDVADDDALSEALAATIRQCGAAFIETDMRAHRNPQRMRTIKRATLDLIRRAHSRCPACAVPGYGVTGRVSGLPCAWCQEPTDLTRAEILSCAACDHRVERPVAALAAEPGQCPHCNP